MLGRYIVSQSVVQQHDPVGDVMTCSVRCAPLLLSAFVSWKPPNETHNTGPLASHVRFYLTDCYGMKGNSVWRGNEVSVYDITVEWRPLLILQSRRQTHILCVIPVGELWRLLQYMIVQYGLRMGKE